MAKTNSRASRIVHQLDGRPRGMRQDGLRGVDGAHLLGLVGHVLDDDGGHVGALVVGLVDEGGAAAACAATGPLATGRGGCGGHGGVEDGRVGLVVELGEGGGEVIGVDELVGGVLEAHLPAVGRARGWGDEEELAGVGEGEMLVAGTDGCVLAKVDLDLLAEDGLAVPYLADEDGAVLVKEGDDDATEGLEGRKCVDEGGCRDEVADGGEVIRGEYLCVV